MSIIEHNIILSQDCYKFSHPFMINRDVTGLTSYIEPRKGSSIVFFGLQAYIREYLSKPITMEQIDEAEKFAKSALIPFCREMWEHIVTHHGGFLPIRIQAVQEGRIVDGGTPVVQVTSMDTKYPGIISVIETSLLRAIWYPSSVATVSRHIKVLMRDYLVKTSDKNPNDILPTMLNDFGARGTSSHETASLGGLAHAINFIGSDTIEAIKAAIVYYDHSLDRDGPVIISVPATEHSVTTMNGEEGEMNFVRNTIQTFTSMGFPIISIVADSYDMEKFVNEYIGIKLKPLIDNRNGKIVIRPDSGDPVESVSTVVNSLWRHFGGSINSKGYKVLHPTVGVIQGDGIDLEEINKILEDLKNQGFSAENIVFGMGGKLLQAPMRDDYSWAMKTNAVKYQYEDIWYNVQKKPKTDMSKASKAGRQALYEMSGKLYPMREDALPTPDTGSHGVVNHLEDVWVFGKVIRTQTFVEVRKNAQV